MITILWGVVLLSIGLVLSILLIGLFFVAKIMRRSTCWICCIIVSFSGGFWRSCSIVSTNRLVQTTTYFNLIRIIKARVIAIIIVLSLFSILLASLFATTRCIWMFLLHKFPILMVVVPPTISINLIVSRFVVVLILIVVPFILLILLLLRLLRLLRWIPCLISWIWVLTPICLIQIVVSIVLVVPTFATSLIILIVVLLLRLSNSCCRLVFIAALSHRSTVW